MNHYRLLWPIPGRVIVAGLMLVLAAGRLGLYRHGPRTQIPDLLYGVPLALIALGLIATGGKRSLHWPARTLAAIGAGLLAFQATDTLITAGGINTSSMMLFWLAITLIVEAGARREC